MRLRPALRLADLQDADTLFRWRNLPWVVSLGSSNQRVSRREHDEWFGTVLSGDHTRVFIVSVGAEDIGMIRFDLADSSAPEVSIYLMPDYQDQAIGPAVFFRSLAMLDNRPRQSSVRASVKRDNHTSLGFFRKLGFVDKKEAPSGAEFVQLEADLQMVPHSLPSLGETEAAAAQRVIMSRHLAQGPYVNALESEWSRRCGKFGSVAVSSGFSALRLGLLALGIGERDEVILPAYSCVALINAVLAVNAVPVLADVQNDDWTIDVEDVRRRTNPATKAIIAVHLFGCPADPAIFDLGVPVIEDCAHGIGGHCGGVPFGGRGTVSMGSFYATKMISGGEGGIISSNEPSVLSAVQRSRDYGDQSPSRDYMNDKMTDVEAAIALCQLDRLEEMLKTRSAIAYRYTEMLRYLSRDGLLAIPSDADGRIWYRYVIRLCTGKAPSISREMTLRGVAAEQPVWDLRGCDYWGPGLDQASRGFDRLLSLPIYPDLTETQQECVVQTLTAVLDA